MSLSTLEIQDQNFKFFFYSRNSRSEFQISLSNLEFTFLTLVHALGVWMVVVTILTTTSSASVISQPTRSWACAAPSQLRTIFDKMGKSFLRVKMLNRCVFLGEICGEIITFGWWMITFEGTQCMWTNPSKNPGRMVRHSLPSYKAGYTLGTPDDICPTINWATFTIMMKTPHRLDQNDQNSGSQTLTRGPLPQSTSSHLPATSSISTNTAEHQHKNQHQQDHQIIITGAISATGEHNKQKASATAQRRAGTIISTKAIKSHTKHQHKYQSKGKTRENNTKTPK